VTKIKTKTAERFLRLSPLATYPRKLSQQPNKRQHPASAKSPRSRCQRAKERSEGSCSFDALDATISATVADLTIRGAIEALVPEQQLEIWTFPRSFPDLPALPPRILTRCADCGLATIIACENYRMRDFVWERAWAGRLKPWHKAPAQQVLCIACLEHRIGRQLIRDDFVSASD
jgi:hypothetical protein